MQIRKKFLKLEDELNEIIKERQEATRGLTLALLTKNHCFFIGITGTAKSMLIKTLSDSIEGAKYFEHLIFQATRPEELFGVIDVSKVVEGRNVRKTEGYLPDVHFAFLDEIWKGNSAILNGLLKIINEREFRNDNKIQKCPLETVLSASNELPEDENLDAIWDRFLLRYKVGYVTKDSSLKEIMTMRDSSPNTTLTLDEIHEAQDEVKNVQISDDILEMLIMIRNQLKIEGLIPSDRRMRAITNVLRAQAWLDGRDKVIDDDLNIITHMLWDDTTEIQKVNEVVLSEINPKLGEARELYDGILESYRAYQKSDESEKTKAIGEATMDINNAKRRLVEIKKLMDSEDRSTEEVERFIYIAKEKIEEMNKYWTMED